MMNFLILPNLGQLQSRVELREHRIARRRERILRYKPIEAKKATEVKLWVLGPLPDFSFWRTSLR